MSRDLPPIYDTILNELESQYVLGYIPANSRHQGKWRKVRVEVKPDKLRVRHRAGYYEPLG
jgi:hypothetical protein